MNLGKICHIKNYLVEDNAFILCFFPPLEHYTHLCMIGQDCYINEDILR